MTAKHKPATALPWAQVTRTIHHGIVAAHNVRVAEVRECTSPKGSTAQDAAYIVHAANAYPKLVEALRMLAVQADVVVQASNGDNLGLDAEAESARALLRELGEAE